eukprot:TRINITY_DN14910_c0_g1_i1.p1 TRINITY_DN14910_c0_g1~~TRINITY_DN14910_c0_g1_i1.p1  ORF type:complete len:557 (-),score=132.13 TRINITY_DN14910_c0_g1_i1:123-1793(-)
MAELHAVQRHGRWLRRLAVGVWLLAQPKTSSGQGAPMDPGSVPPGMKKWLGRDQCSTAPWVAAFHDGLGTALNKANARDFSGALEDVAKLMSQVVISPTAAFECATALASTMFVAAHCAEQVGQPLLATRLRQLSAIFASFDYQMKGEEYIDQSVWPIRWMENMEGILRSMMFLKEHERRIEPWRGANARALLADSASSSSKSAPSLRVAIVSVCDYDAGQTPLARLSQINKEAYARKHGYDVIIYDKAPVFQDPLTVLMTEPPSHRPAAWSKVDAILTTMAQSKHDWILWMDCDSFFMDEEVRLDALADSASQASGCSSGSSSLEDLVELRRLVKRWYEGPQQQLDGAALLEWYDSLFREHWSASDASCGTVQQEVEPPMNSTLGFDDWLFRERRPQLLASEDGLMLNTGVMLIRGSAWAWQFFQKVRQMTFGVSPVTQHPWWEQTAMVYLLQLPFTLEHASRRNALGDLGGAFDRGYAPACFMLSQKQINGYPPLVAAALKTHETFQTGDFIVSFSGCKVYSSQEVCNELFLNYFFQVHDPALLETDSVLRLWR